MFDFFATSFDLPILDWIQHNLHSGFMDWFMPFITMFGEAGIFWIACAALLLIIPKTRKTGLAMGIALLMGLIICNGILKNVCARPRPYDYQLDTLKNTWADFLINGKLLVEGLSDYSFPSGHTIASFEAAGVLMIRNKKLGIPALILACLIAFSRLYLYVHYPTDVIVSVILGTAFAFISNWLVNKFWGKLPARLRGEPT